MKPFPLLALCCAALPLSAVAVHARPAAPKAVQATLQKLYDRENAAIAAKDMKAVWSLRTPDYEAIRHGQRRNAAQVRAAYRQMFAEAHSLKGTARIQSLTLHGRTAQVKVAEAATFVITHPLTKRNAVLKTSSISLDDWVQRNGHWLKRRSRSLSQTGTLDGKGMSG